MENIQQESQYGAINVGDITGFSSARVLKENKNKLCLLNDNEKENIIDNSKIEGLKKYKRNNKNTEREVFIFNLFSEYLR